MLTTIISWLSQSYEISHTSYDYAIIKKRSVPFSVTFLTPSLFVSVTQITCEFWSTCFSFGGIFQVYDLNFAYAVTFEVDWVRTTPCLPGWGDDKTWFTTSTDEIQNPIKWMIYIPSHSRPWNSQHIILPDNISK